MELNGRLVIMTGLRRSKKNIEAGRNTIKSEIDDIEKEKSMKHEFKVGDKVRIRQWDDMVKEFGVDSDEDIKCNRSFTKDMKHLCGRTATLTSIGVGTYIQLKDWSCNDGDLGWTYSIDMIEPAESVKPLILVYPNSKNRNETIAVRKNGNTVISTAKANYNPNDEKRGLPYSFEKGAEIALKRLLGIEIEDKPVVEVPTYMEVKRAAKVGEYVKIVNACDTCDCYTNGDIYCVSDVISCGVYFKTQKTHKCCERRGLIGYSYASYDEYVVLEGYQPTLNWNEFKEGKFAVHCDTEEKANDFLKECEEQGIKWSDGDKLSYDNNYSSYKNETAYSCEKGFKMYYCEQQHYESLGIKVIDYNPFNTQKIFTEKIKSDISTFSNAELAAELTRRLSK